MSGTAESCGKGETLLAGSGAWVCTGQYILQNYRGRMDNRVILKPYTDVQPEGKPKYSACADCPARRPLPAEEASTGTE
jgi:hypothetical protein